MSERWSTTLLRAVLALAIVCGVTALIMVCFGFGPGEIAGMFAHPVSGGTGTAVPAAPTDVSPAKAQLGKGFGALDHVVLIVYLAGMLVIGWIASRRVKTARNYFIGSGRMNYVLVGVSLLGSYLSALTMMSLSGASYGDLNWLYVAQLPFLILTAIIITRFVLPKYREAGVISVYEFLEQRIDISARMLASVSFVLLSIGRMGLVLYLPALALATATGISLPLSIIIAGVIITIYTAMGGIEAVIWNDVIQVVIIVAGAFLTMWYIFADIGVQQFIDVASAHNKFQIINPSLNIAEITTLWLILETIFQTVRIYGNQQDMTQRYMSTESTAKANRSVWLSIAGYIPLGFIFYFIGTGLFVFYQVHPDPSLPGVRESIYPYFIVNSLPAGVSGLVIAAILAASMSTIDSLMNSSSTVCVEDFLKRFGRKKRTEGDYLSKARLLTWMWGVLCVVMALVFMVIGSEYTQIIWGMLMAITTNGMVALTALAFLPFRVNKWAAISGFAVSYVCLILMMSTKFKVEPFLTIDSFLSPPHINFLLWTVVGNVVCFVVALGVNAALSREPSVAAENT